MKLESNILKVENLIRNYWTSKNKEKAEEIKVLKGLSFEVKEGEFVGIMGKSGCGKTTLLKVLGMIDRHTDGKVYFRDMDTQELWKDELSDIRRRNIGFIFQDFYLMDSLSVIENIMIPMVIDKGKAKKCISEATRLAEMFGVDHLLNKKVYEISGGEKQRVAICRALINEPDLILADEPTGNLDSKSGDMVIHALEKINQELGKTILMVTHDAKIASYCTRLIFLKDGEILDELERNESQESFYREIVKKIDML